MKQVTKFKFLLLFVLFVLGLWIISYSIIIPNYEKIEKSKNHVNIKTILFNIDSRITYIKNMIIDYAQWDDTYSFINGMNDGYINENFREGTQTLEGLEIDFAIFVNKHNNIVYSIYQSESTDLNQKMFEETILKKFENSKKVDQLILFEKKPFFITREEIKRSDSTGSFSGYLYAGKLIAEKDIYHISKVFKKSHLSLKKLEIKDEKTLESKYLEKITLSTKIANQKIYSVLNFYSEDKFLFSIETENSTLILKEGIVTTFFYNLLVIALFFILILIVYKNQKKLESFNLKLEEEVHFRTNDLTRSMKLVEEKNEELYKLANIDTLTQIKNRRSFFLESNRVLESALKEGKNFSVILIDVDYFKNVNDTYGHAIGDIVLQKLCEIVNKTIKKDDIFGRLGGEEFCISVINKNDDEVYELAELLRKNCEDNILRIEHQDIKFTISLGITSLNGTKFTNIDKLLHEADVNLYRAKNSGRNRVCRS